MAPGKTLSKQLFTLSLVGLFLIRFITHDRYTKLGYAGNKEPQFIIPSGKTFLLHAQSLK